MRRNTSLVGLAVRMYRQRYKIMLALVAVTIPSSGYPETKDCYRYLVNDWSDQERWVWTAVCHGVEANFNKEPRFGRIRNAKEDCTSWPQSRTIRPGFIELILTDDSYRKALPRHGIRIVGARFTERVDLAGATIEHQLWLDNSCLIKGVNLNRTKSTNLISFDDSVIGGILAVNDFEGKILMLRNAFVDSLYIAESRMIGSLDLSGIRIQKDLWIDRTRIGGSLLLRNGDLRSTTNTNIVYTQIGGNLELHGARISRLNLRGTHIASELNLIGSHRTHTTWEPDARLELHGARIGVLRDSHESWPKTGRIELDGFGLPSAGGIIGSDGDTMASRDTSWLLHWLGRQPKYAPQPYEEVARVLKAAGYQEKATAVLFASRQEDRRNATGGRWFWLVLEEYLVGYGYYPHRCVAWVAGLTVLGALVLALSRDLRDTKRPLHEVWASDVGRLNEIKQIATKDLYFSFDLLLPLIQLRARHYDKSLPLRPVTELYFVIHRLCGYVLGFLLVASITGLAR